MATKINTILRNQSGAALVIALIMIVVITLIALASSYTSIFEMKISGNIRGLTNAFYAADAGINAITAQPSSFPLISNTGASLNYPFQNANVQNPANIPSSNASITYYKNLEGPPRGGGYSAVNVSYAYFLVQCTGSDSAVTGVSAVNGAKVTLYEDVMQIIPIAQQQEGS